MITIGGLRFEEFIAEEEIQSLVNALAKEVDTYYNGKSLTVIVVLKGAYIFASDLMRAMEVDSTIHFIQLSSYVGTESSGSVDITMGNLPDLTNHHVLIVEDIVDTGLSISTLIKQEIFTKVASLNICTFLLKPDSLKANLETRFVGKSIPSAFVIGYGLDYNEEARNLKSIFIKEE